MSLMSHLGIILVAAGAVTYVARRVHIPTVVVLIVLGMILGTHPVKGYLIGPHSRVISYLGDIGLLCLMFLAGLESSWHLLYKERKDAAMVAVFGLVIPFVMGVAVFRLIGFTWKAALIIGICMSISAEAVRAKVLLELDKLNTRVGAALIGAGLLDDLMGLSLFAFISYFIQEAGTKEELLVVLSIVVFFAGLSVQRIIGQKQTLMVGVERCLNYVIVPFFFIAIGSHFSFSSLFVHMDLLALVLIIAVAGKLAGAFVIRPCCGFSWPQLHLIGWAMNSRGALGLALALIAFRSELISVEIYSCLILMAFVTTLTFPFIITHMIRTHKGVME